MWQQNPNSRRYFWESSHRVKAADSALGANSQIKVADVVLGSLFYLRHVRSCAASTAGSNKSAGDSGPLSCSPSGLRTVVEYVRDWVQSAFTSSGFGVELAILWILLGNHQVEYWRLGFPVILRLCGVHIPISWCRLLTCVSVGSVVWESSSWAMRGLWMVYL